jgi:hypothetical protein
LHISLVSGLSSAEFGAPNPQPHFECFNEVLIVNNSVYDRDVLKEMFRHMSLLCEEAESGADAIVEVEKEA